MGNLIEIVRPEETHKWKFVDPSTKQQYDSEFELRVVGKELERSLRKKHTRVEFNRHGRNEVVDTGEFVDDVIDYAIVNWSGVRHQGRELPCTKEFKIMLPEIVRAEVIRLCLGKELGEILAGTDMESDARPTLKVVASAPATD